MKHTSHIGAWGAAGDASAARMREPRVAAPIVVAALSAVAGGAAIVGAQRIDVGGDVAAGSAEIVAGLSLFASALLAVLVCLARTRIELQRSEIERLRARTLEGEPHGDLAGEAGYGVEHGAGDRFDVRESER